MSLEHPRSLARPQLPSHSISLPGSGPATNTTLKKQIPIRRPSSACHHHQNHRAHALRQQRQQWKRLHEVALPAVSRVHASCLGQSQQGQARHCQPVEHPPSLRRRRATSHAASAVLHEHEAASPPRAPPLQGGACGMHDKIACAKRNNTQPQRKSIYTA